MLKLYNSLNRKLEQFSSFKKDEIKMYVCGITPYDTTHLGHAFTYVFFDSLVRFLSFKGFKVIYTQNVTDIDNDILKRAKEQNKDWKELGNFWTNKFLTDMKNLNVLSPTHYVKATDSITTMIRIIEVLIDKEFAYVKNGNVYFSVKKFNDYGKLSNFTTEQMLIISKDRGGNPDDPLMENPLDFILWQSADQPGEPFWESPWGKGRPGWHIECSAMINQYLDDHIDIHGGGRDLIFPHHESEIAQSESFTGLKPFVKYWLHTAMVIYKGEKMSKSLGNLIMVSDLLKNHSANVIRYVLLSHQYRIPWEFDESELSSAENNIKLIESALKSNGDKRHEENEKVTEFINALENDLNTPLALSTIVRLAKEVEKGKSKKTLSDLCNVLGFNFSS